MKINGWIKASNQWKQDVPELVAVPMNYSLEPWPAPARLSSPCSAVTGRTMAVSELDFVYSGPSLEGSQTASGLGEFIELR